MNLTTDRDATACRPLPSQEELVQAAGGIILPGQLTGRLGVYFCHQMQVLWPNPCSKSKLGCTSSSSLSWQQSAVATSAQPQSWSLMHWPPTTLFSTWAQTGTGVENSFVLCPSNMTATPNSVKYWQPPNLWIGTWARSAMQVVQGSWMGLAQELLKFCRVQLLNSNIHYVSSQLHGVFVNVMTHLYLKIWWAVTSMAATAHQVETTSESTVLIKNQQPVVHANPWKHNSRLNIYQRKIRNIDVNWLIWLLDIEI